MLEFSVPDDIAQVLNELKKLDPEFRSELISTLNKVRQDQNLGQFARELSTQFTQQDLNWYSQLFDWTANLIHFKELAKLSNKEFSNVLKDLYKEGIAEDFEKELLQLFDSGGAFYLATKTHDLKLENQNIFKMARILTDVRPVFAGSDGECEIRGRFVQHTLKIEFENEGTRDSAFITMDGEDIKFLSKLLERAEEKENTLNEYFEIPVKAHPKNKIE